MRKPPPFDSQYEAADSLAERIAAEGSYCVAAIGAFGGDETRSADEVFLEQNARFQAHIADAATLDAQLAELVFSLDRLTAEVSADLDSFRGLTPREKMAYAGCRASGCGACIRNACARRRSSNGCSTF